MSVTNTLLRDLATVSLALGVAALLAATRPTWRVPVLAITLLQFALHTLNHLLDIVQAEPSWLGSGQGARAGVGDRPWRSLMRSYVTGGSGVIGR